MHVSIPRKLRFSQQLTARLSFGPYRPEQRNSPVRGTQQQGIRIVGTAATCRGCSVEVYGSSANCTAAAKAVQGQAAGLVPATGNSPAAAHKGWLVDVTGSVGVGGAKAAISRGRHAHYRPDYMCRW